MHKLVSFARNPVILLEKSEIGEPKASGIFRPQSGRKIVGRGKSASALAAPAGTKKIIRAHGVGDRAVA